MHSWLKKLPARKLQIEDNTNAEYKDKVHENDRTNISSTPGVSSSLVTLWSNNNDPMPCVKVSATKMKP